MSEIIVEVKDIYSGPMDVLLDLIKEEEIDIYDIPIIYLTERFIETMESISYQTIDSYLEFSEFAATLLEIKSQIMLPVETEEDDEIDPREELMKRLLEYNYYKEISDVLVDYYEAGSKYLEKSPEDTSILSLDESIEYDELNPEGLTRTLSRMLTRLHYEEKEVDITIPVQTISVEDCVDSIKRTLTDKRVFRFSSLFELKMRKSEIVAYFLAMLELGKNQLVTITQYEEEIVIEPNDRKN